MTVISRTLVARIFNNALYWTSVVSGSEQNYLEILSDGDRARMAVTRCGLLLYARDAASTPPPLLKNADICL